MSVEPLVDKDPTYLKVFNYYSQARVEKSNIYSRLRDPIILMIPNPVLSLYASREATIAIKLVNIGLYRENNQ